MRQAFLVGIILILGAVVLSPVVAAFEFDRVPGDIAFRMGNAHINIPVAYSLCASLGLALLYKIMKR
jgi:hypothetical protein